jgi:hypothetical protein
MPSSTRPYTTAYSRLGGDDEFRYFIVAGFSTTSALLAIFRDEKWGVMGTLLAV